MLLSLLDLGGELRRPGATRWLAETLARHDAGIACAHGIDAGDALALATRCDRKWAYRGGEAIFWQGALHVRAIHHRDLPFAVRRPFARRGMLHVEGRYDDGPLEIFATSLAADRGTRIRDLRFLRRVVRAAGGTAVLFVGNGASARGRFADLGFGEAASDDYNVIVVRPSQAIPAPQTAGSHAASASIERI